MDLKRTEKRLEELLNVLHEKGKDNDGGITRLAYSKKDNNSHEFIKKTMDNEGFETRYDAIGNLYITLKGVSDKKIVIGSHIDSVPNGGNYDGTIGVLAGIEILRTLKEKNKLDHAIEVVSFRAEESSRFNKAMIGSSAVTNKLTTDDLKKLHDSIGLSAYELIKLSGFNPDNLDKSLWDKSKIKCYLEAHIEQGRVLETLQRDIGVVTGIAAPVRYIIKLQGRDDHSGATPMNMRLDAMDAYNLMGVHKINVLDHAFKKGYDTVCTIGDVIVPRGSMNKVCGEANFYIDLRDSDISHRDEVESQLKSGFDDICNKRGIKIMYEETERKNPVALDKPIIDMTKNICKELSINYHVMPSGAGHDGMNLSYYGLPVGMIFVPSKDGVSHSKDEFTKIEDIVKGTKVLYEMVLRIDKS